MPVTAIPNSSPNALASPSALIDWLADELIANHQFVSRRDEATENDGSTKALRWVERVTANTFHGDGPLTVGLFAGTTVSSTLGDTLDDASLLLSYNDYATATAASTNFVNDVSGTPVVPNSNTVASWHCGITNMGAGPLRRGWLITNPSSGSSTPTEELSFIVVFEGTTQGVYGMFGFGEVVKLTQFTGGMWASGNRISSTARIDAQSQELFCNPASEASFSQTTSKGDCPPCIWSSDWGPSLALTDSFGWMIAGGGDSSAGGGNTQNHWPLAGLGSLSSLGYILARSPSAFSLQSEKYPPVFFGATSKDIATNYQGHAPMALIPNVFLADVLNVDEFTVITDSAGDKFIPVPYRTKVGTGNGVSGRFGVLIRNPALV